MNKEQIKSELGDLIGSILVVKKEDIDYEQSWIEAGIESFALVETLVGIQDHFDIQIETPELESVTTINHMVELINRKLSE